MSLIPAWTLLAILAASIIYPVVFIAFTSLKTMSGYAADPVGPPSQPTLENLQTVVSRGLLGTNAVNSAIISVLSSLGVVVISSMAGFALTFLKFPFRKTLLLGIVGLMIQPTALLMIPMVLTVSNFGLLSTYVGIVLVYMGLGIPFGTYLMYSYMQSTPRDLIDAARVDGASTFNILFQVVIPLVAPALGALATLNFIGFWNEFLFALLILQGGDQTTLIVALASLQSEHFLNVPLIASGMVISILPPLVVFVALHRRLFSGLTAGAVQG
jgi:ABC-type glycerol-3-phosphate transport system permease component